MFSIFKKKSQENRRHHRQSYFRLFPHGDQLLHSPLIELSNAYTTTPMVLRTSPSFEMEQ